MTLSASPVHREKGRRVYTLAAAAVPRDLQQELYNEPESIELRSAAKRRVQQQQLRRLPAALPGGRFALRIDFLRIQPGVRRCRRRATRYLSRYILILLLLRAPPRPRALLSAKNLHAPRKIYNFSHYFLSRELLLLLLLLFTRQFFFSSIQRCILVSTVCSSSSSSPSIGDWLARCAAVASSSFFFFWKTGNPFVNHRELAGSRELSKKSAPSFLYISKVRLMMCIGRFVMRFWNYNTLAFCSKL